MDRAVFRKTAAGLAEVRQRALGLDARTRGVLILANGELSVEQLAQHVGFDPLRTLMSLLGAGLLEPVASAPRVRPAVAAPESLAAPEPAAPRAPHPLAPADLDAARTRALAALVPHYGPDAVRLAAPLRAASSADGFALALAELQDTLAVHMGRKLAAQLARQIAHGP